MRSAKLPKNSSFFKKVFYSRLTLVVIAITFIYIVNGTWEVYQKATQARAQKERLENELIALEKRRADLEEKLNALTTERGVEAEIRERFSVAKKGESVVVIVDSPNENLEKVESNSTINRWWNKFLGIFK